MRYLGPNLIHLSKLPDTAADKPSMKMQTYLTNNIQPPDRMNQIRQYDLTTDRPNNRLIIWH